MESPHPEEGDPSLTLPTLAGGARLPSQLLLIRQEEQELVLNSHKHTKTQREALTLASTKIRKRDHQVSSGPGTHSRPKSQGERGLGSFNPLLRPMIGAGFGEPPSNVPLPSLMGEKMWAKEPLQPPLPPSQSPPFPCLSPLNISLPHWESATTPPATQP